MRIWHKDLIPVLPNEQLLAQWGNCRTIISRIKKHGTPNHKLVNKVMDYPILHFVAYTNKVLKELGDRGYRINEKAYCDFVKSCNECMMSFNNTSHIVLSSDDKLFEGWHGKRYLKQCLFILQESYDCGGISDSEWLRVVSNFNLSKM